MTDGRVHNFPPAELRWKDKVRIVENATPEMCKMIMDGWKAEEDRELWQKGYLAALNGLIVSTDRRATFEAFDSDAKSAADLFVQACHEHNERTN